jgi:hypothetical protein
MLSAARLEQLRELIQSDVDALPDRSISPDVLIDDSDSSGGVLLESAMLDVPVCEQDTSEKTDAPVETSPPATATLTAEKPDHRFTWMKDTSSSLNPSLDSLRISDPLPPPNAPEPPITHLQRGDLASAHHHFTPIQALAKYPYTYCSKSHMQDVASAFFDQGKFWMRIWDL